ncbi:MAG: hypothetical protein QF578_10705 [Alphaproteobacteria bacterium]|jgi:hypothetical protein|nr:hypothetical protein [Alphaproteobacteria bacterium]MDP6565286.1 hypothetical protein [Alphaproteobacteria bacterium]MDP6811784.1 hypothetical protein [Alphaproteobacteria bacterium]|tara:strand:+ start:290 stop:469 length:180 start_codon:yes stop_codon:yes gene_type:complete
MPLPQGFFGDPQEWEETFEWLFVGLLFVIMLLALGILKIGPGRGDGGFDGDGGGDGGGE